MKANIEEYVLLNFSSSNQFLLVDKPSTLAQKLENMVANLNQKGDFSPLPFHFIFPFLLLEFVYVYIIIEIYQNSSKVVDIFVILT